MLGLGAAVRLAHDPCRLGLRDASEALDLDGSVSLRRASVSARKALHALLQKLCACALLMCRPSANSWVKSTGCVLEKSTCLLVRHLTCIAANTLAVRIHKPKASCCVNSRESASLSAKFINSSFDSSVVANFLAKTASQALLA